MALPLIFFFNLFIFLSFFLKMGKKNNQQLNKVADYILADAGVKICSLTK
jgi:hypothetical protein